MKRIFMAICAAAAALQSQPASVVTGRVTDDRGQALRAEVTAIANAAGVRITSAMTDESGRFSLNVAPGAVLVTAHAEGHVSAEQQLAVAPGRTAQAGQLSLSPAGSVSGVVLDSAGGVVSGARVWLGYRDERAGWRRADEAGGEETDAAGRFAIPLVAQGRAFVLHVEAEGWLLTSSGTMMLRGREMTGVLLPLVRRGASVSGRVTDAGGRAVSGASVRLRVTPASTEFSDEQRASIAFANTTNRAVESGPDGRYRFTGVPAGRVVVTAELTGTRGSVQAQTSPERETLADLILQ